MPSESYNVELFIRVSHMTPFNDGVIECRWLNDKTLKGVSQPCGLCMLLSNALETIVELQFHLVFSLAKDWQWTKGHIDM